MFYSTPPVTRTLIGINVAMFAAQLLLGNANLLSFALADSVFSARQCPWLVDWLEVVLRSWKVFKS